MSLVGKCAIVVGGTSGIGEGIALQLAKSNCAVTIVGRDRERADAVCARLAAASSDAAVRKSHRFVALDVSLLANSRVLAREHGVGAPLDFLVMTMGIGAFDGFKPTAEGLDIKLALHYFARAAIALQFAPTLAQSSDGRMLTVLTAGVHPPYAEYSTNFEVNTAYNSLKAANAATFYNDIMTEMLNKDFPAITTTHAAPGAVASNWGRQLPWYMRAPIRFAQLFMTSNEVCGERLAPTLTRGGDYKGTWHLVNRKSEPVRKTALHDQAKDEVWLKTKQLVECIVGKL